MQVDQIKQTLKEEIVERLDLYVEPSDIKDDEMLFGFDEDGNGLGLDSIDVLEIIVAISQNFGVEIDAEENREIFKNINTISQFVFENLNK